MLSKKQGQFAYGWRRRQKAVSRLYHQLNGTGRYEGKPALSIEKSNRIKQEIHNIENKHE